jgi:NAD(P) transhydrogenase subunit alpha
MLLGIPREIVDGERRVAIVPETVQKLVRAGTSVLVESGAGAGSYHEDSAYEAAGATIAGNAEELYAKSDIIAKIHRPQRGGAVDEIALLRSGTSLIAMLWPLQHPDLARQIAERGVTAYSMDAVPRIARAQALDVLSSMSSLAGYRAVIMAAESLPRYFPMLMTAAGTLTPARVFIIGAGVAGLQAIATARRLGAVVEAFDTRPVVKEQVQSLGATFVEAALGAAATEDKGGYATALTDDAQQRALALIGSRASQADVIITTALVPGKRAPLLVTEDMVRSMRPGSVIVDLAGEFGGNCALSKPGSTTVAHAVTIHAPLNLPASMPVHASQMYSRNVAAFLALLLDGAAIRAQEDQVVRDMCITRGGEIVHEGTRNQSEAAAGAQRA